MSSDDTITISSDHLYDTISIDDLNLTLSSASTTSLPGAAGSGHISIPSHNNYTLPSYNFNTSGSYTVGTASGLNGTWMTSNPASSGLTCTGDANFEGDVKIKGISIAKALEDIQKRLAILVPDPAKLEHFAALKRAYEHYKTLEALCQLPITEDKE